ncbi:MAG: hypothetical protein U5L96_17690 [Owenweeksia sp.]|nr:hypothetical protein [Owenweeksia sp.]
METLTPLSITLIVAGAALGYGLSWLWLKGRLRGMAAPLRQKIQQLENEKSQLSF